MEDQDSAARALRESEELHRITLINMSDAVFITDDDGVFTFICANVDVIFGYRSDEVRALGRIARLLGRDLVDRRQLATAGEVRNIEHEIVRKDGGRRALLLHIKQVAIKGGTTLYACRDITERKQAEETIRRSEERLKLALEAASMGLWDWHVPTGEMSWSYETHRLLGDAARTRVPSFDSFLERIDSADRDRVHRNMAEALERGASYETEFRVHGYDDVDRWVMGKGKAVRNGKPLRMIGVFVDFTDRYQVDRELRELGGRLINAHEQERVRLSRELHDDVAQRVGLMSVELAQLRDRLNPASQEVAQQIATLSAQTREIGAELHRLSHELHPARLRHLGLEASIQGFCEELAEAHDLTIIDDIAELPRPLADDATLCLYRITQEALHNVIKHSGATSASVTLAVEMNEVVLTVSDNGAGFDPRAAFGKGTLGLVSMRERARLVRGRFDLWSRPGHGTTVAVRIPVREEASV